MSTPNDQPPHPPDPPDARGRRLESWKEIAAYFGRDVRTIQRWEQRDELPVHRLHHSKLGSVFAYTAELDGWREARAQPLRSASPPDSAASPTTADMASSDREPLPGVGTDAISGGVIARRVDNVMAPRRGVTRLAVPMVAVLVPVIGFAGLLLARATWDFESGAPPVTSIAVLPLADLSPARDQAYLADGMTEALIGRLSASPTLRVIARTSVIQFKDSRTPVRDIARVLDVDAIVEGSVVRDGDRLRIHAQLVRAETQEGIWAAAYDRELRDVLTLQREVAETIVREIHAIVSASPAGAAMEPGSVAAEAYEHYLKGRFLLNKRGMTASDAAQAIHLFERAIQRDPTFADAHAGLAAAYQTLGATGTALLPVIDTIPKTMAAVTRALELDPHGSEALTILGDADKQAWQWARAEARYRDVLAREPSNARAHFALAALLVSLGRTEEGLALARRGRGLDPLSPARTVQLGWLLYHARRYNEAIRELRTVLAADPDHISASWFLGFALIDSSHYEEAIRTGERLADVWNRNPAALGMLARAYGQAGRHADARRILNELMNRARQGYVAPAVFIHAFVGVGDLEGAIGATERAYREHSNIIQNLKTHPVYDPIRQDARFQALSRHVGLF